MSKNVIKNTDLENALKNAFYKGKDFVPCAVNQKTGTVYYFLREGEQVEDQSLVSIYDSSWSEESAINGVKDAFNRDFDSDWELTTVLLKDIYDDMTDFID